MKKIKISKKWRLMAEVYKEFSDPGYDFSEAAAEQMYLKETFGEAMRPLPSGKVNGYAVGKSRLNLTMTAYWLPDLEEGKILFVRELYEDFPYEVLKMLPKKWHIPKTQADELYKNAEPYRLYRKKMIASFTKTI